jgi:hypothetical protein
MHQDIVMLLHLHDYRFRLSHYLVFLCGQANEGLVINCVLVVAEEGFAAAVADCWGLIVH